ncbi:MAG: CAP domain-containing protein [Actinobacteria bacterium]|nr:CAP domain-containing protein [Actinomycetota bacterium]
MKRARQASGWLIGFALIALLLQFAAASVANASPSEDGFAQKINEERSRRGLAALAYDSGLLDIARSHSKKMADEGRLHHNTSLPEQIADWEALGENVGRGPSVDAIHEAFMSSPSHRSQVLSSDYLGYAVGVYQVGEEIWVTELFIRRSSSPVAPSTVKSASSRKAPTNPSVPAAPAVVVQPNEQLISANSTASILRHFFITVPMWDGGIVNRPATGLVLATAMLLIGIAFTHGLLFSWPIRR